MDSDTLVQAKGKDTITVHTKIGLRFYEGYALSTKLET
jgi:hypothetical protein